MLFNVDFPTSRRNQMQESGLFRQFIGTILRVSQDGQHDTLIRRWGVQSHTGTSHDDHSPQCLVACDDVISRADGTVGRPSAEFPDNQASLPVAAVFFLPKSSVLSPLALDIVAQTARRANSGSIVVIRANHDHEAGGTARRRVFGAMLCAMS